MKSAKSKRKPPNHTAKPEAIEPELLGDEEPKRTGRPSSYTAEMGDRICEAMSQGMGLRAVCELAWAPHRTTVLRWVEDIPRFREQYARARDALYDWIAEEIIRISDDSTQDHFVDGATGDYKPDHARVQRDRLRVDSRKWLLSKLAKRYSDKPEFEKTDDDKIVQFQWIEHGPGSAPPVQPEPKLIGPPRPSEPRPGNLSDADWQLLSEMLGLARQALQGRDEPPAKVFSGLIAYLRRFLDGE